MGRFTSINGASTSDNGTNSTNANPVPSNDSNVVVGASNLNSSANDPTNTADVSASTPATDTGGGSSQPRHRRRRRNNAGEAHPWQNDEEEYVCNLLVATGGTGRGFVSWRDIADDFNATFQTRPVLDANGNPITLTRGVRSSDAIQQRFRPWLAAMQPRLQAQTNNFGSFQAPTINWRQAFTTYQAAHPPVALQSDTEEEEDGTGEEGEGDGSGDDEECSDPNDDLDALWEREVEEQKKRKKNGP